MNRVFHLLVMLLLWTVLPCEAASYTMRVPITGLKGPAQTAPSQGSVTSLLHFDGSLSDQNGMSITKSAGAVISSSTFKVGSGALSIPGAGDYIREASSSAEAFGTDDFTLEFWVYYVGTTNSYIVLFDNMAPQGSLLVIRFGDSGYSHKLQVIVGSDPADIIAPGLTKSSFIGAWHHLAVTRATGTVRLYFDGTLQSTATGKNANFPAGSFYLGGNGTYGLKGYIDEFRLTKGYARYTGNSFTPSTTPFTYP